MSIIDLPVNLPVQSQSFGIRRFELSSSNGDNGSTQTRILGPSRLTCAITSEDAIPVKAEAALWRSLIFSLRGRVNQLAVFDVQRPVPDGTARGNWTAYAAVAAGVNTFVINAGISQVGRTLLMGDWIGVNQSGSGRQLLHVQQDCIVNSSGLMAVTFAEVLRVPVGAGSTVAWQRPTCLMRQTVDESKWKSESRTQGGFSLDLMESWT